MGEMVSADAALDGADEGGRGRIERSAEPPLGIVGEPFKLS